MGTTKRPGGEFYLPIKKIDRAPDDHTGRHADEVFGLGPWRADKPVVAARKSFLTTIESLELGIKAEHGAGVLESLKIEVLPQYSKRRAERGQLLTDTRLFPLDKAIENYNAHKLSSYGQALIGWLLRWNLTEDWILTVATTTLGHWEFGWCDDFEGLQRGDKYEWQLPQDLGSHQPENWFHLKGQGLPETFHYDPLSSDRRVEEERFQAMLDGLHLSFNAFLNQHDQRAQKNGAQRSQEIRQPLQFEWLVRWQVQGWDDERIACHYCDLKNDMNYTTGEAVRKSRERLAKQIGLKLR